MNLGPLARRMLPLLFGAMLGASFVTRPVDASANDNFVLSDAENTDEDNAPVSLGLNAGVELPPCTRNHQPYPGRPDWGWENGAICQIMTDIYYPDCRSAAADPDGDGWGWENNHTCINRSGPTNPVPRCRDQRSDPDGDGWGWENNASCRTTPRSGGWGGSGTPWCHDRRNDPDGDGWGWENGHTCRVGF